MIRASLVALVLSLAFPISPDEPGSATCPAKYATCDKYEDATAAGAGRQIQFECCDYKPQCLRVKAGQSVTWSGDFEEHPFVHECGPEKVSLQAKGGKASFTFTKPGVYGFFCETHGDKGGKGMAGAVEVVP